MVFGKGRNRMIHGIVKLLESKCTHVCLQVGLTWRWQARVNHCHWPHIPLPTAPGAGQTSSRSNGGGSSSSPQEEQEVAAAGGGGGGGGVGGRTTTTNAGLASSGRSRSLASCSHGRPVSPWWLVRERPAISRSSRAPPTSPRGHAGMWQTLNAVRVSPLNNLGA